MNRIDRLHAILTHLQSKKRVTAQEIADRFNISLRTVYRDVKALDESGVPVIGEAGSGYSIMEGYRLPPVMFTQEEASSLLMTGKLAERFNNQSLKKHFDTALYKIKAVLRTTDKEHLDSLENTIAVIRTCTPNIELADKYLGALQKAIVQKFVIFIRYSSITDAITERQVEPIGLTHYGQNWHLIGWCRMRKDYRDFKVSRIQHLQVKEECFEHKSHQTLQEYINNMTRESDLREYIICFTKPVAKYIQDQKYYFGFVRQEEAGENIRMYFLVAGMEGLARWLLEFTNAVKVESPAELQQMMQQFACELYQHYAMAPQERHSL